MLRQQKQLVESLSAQLEERTAQRDVAKAALSKQGRLFFSKSSSLLLPFSAGALMTLLISRRKPAAEPNTSRSAVPIATVVSSASALWSATRPLREEFAFDSIERLLAARKAAHSGKLNEG